VSSDAHVGKRNELLPVERLCALQSKALYSVLLRGNWFTS